MIKQYFNYLLISVVSIVIVYLLTEAWLDPDPKGIGHGIVYLGSAFILAFTGTMIAVIDFFNPAKRLTFLKIFFGILNSLFIIVFISCITNWGMTSDNTFFFSVLLGYTSLTGLILIGLTIRQYMADIKTPGS